MRAVTAQYPDGEHSDDKVFVTDNAVIMLDGASAFVPVPVPASVYADRLGRHVQRALCASQTEDLRVVLRDGIECTARDLRLSPGQSPSSTVTIVREMADRIDVLVLGDNIVVLPDEVIADDRIDQAAPALRERYRGRLAAGYGYDTEHRALLVELQTQQALRRNRPGGYWIAEADPQAAEHAVAASRSVATTPWAVLATDGAYNTMQHLRLTDLDRLVTATETDLASILDRCQSWEATTDPSARQLQRAKRHDDKTLAVLTFGTHLCHPG